MRIVIQARKDIRFGDELTCFNGLKYFQEKPNRKGKEGGMKMELDRAEILRQCSYLR